MSRRQKRPDLIENSKLTPEDVIRERRKRFSYREEIGLFMARIVLFVILLVVLLGVVFGICPVRNNDMMPRLSAGDLLLYYRLGQEYQAQDVIVLEKDGQTYVGRIVARGGDSVEITEDSELEINGSTVLENEIYYRTPQYEDGITYPCKLQEDEYFVLCDYREGAKDSRIYGAVSKAEIKGKVITVIRRADL